MKKRRQWGRRCDRAVSGPLPRGGEGPRQSGSPTRKHAPAHAPTPTGNPEFYNKLDVSRGRGPAARCQPRLDGGKRKAQRPENGREGPAARAGGPSGCVPIVRLQKSSLRPIFPGKNVVCGLGQGEAGGGGSSGLGKQREAPSVRRSAVEGDHSGQESRVPGHGKHDVLSCSLRVGVGE